MRIEMITQMAGPDGNASPGQIIDVDPQTAQALADGGYAVIVDNPAKVEQPPVIETAAMEPQEKAVMPKARKRK